MSKQIPSTTDQPQANDIATPIRECLFNTSSPRSVTPFKLPSTKHTKTPWVDDNPCRSPSHKSLDASSQNWYCTQDTCASRVPHHLRRTSRALLVMFLSKSTWAVSEAVGRDGEDLRRLIIGYETNSATAVSKTSYDAHFGEGCLACSNCSVVLFFMPSLNGEIALGYL